MDAIQYRDKSRYVQTEENEDSSLNNILLKTIYVPKNLMYLTENLPGPKYETMSSSSNQYGSETERKTLKANNMERLNKSPTKRMKENSQNLILPNINNKAIRVRKLSAVSSREHSNQINSGSVNQAIIFK